jgi:hypothetical protein
LPERKPVPHWLIYMLQIMGLLVLGLVAARVAPHTSFFDGLVVEHAVKR